MGLCSLFWKGTTVQSEEEKRVRDDSGRKFGWKGSGRCQPCSGLFITEAVIRCLLVTNIWSKHPKWWVFMPVVREWTFLIWCKVCGDTASPKQLLEHSGNHQEGIGLGEHFVPCICDFVVICKISFVILWNMVFLPVICGGRSIKPGRDHLKEITA